MSTNPLAVPESQPTSQHEIGALGRMTGVIVNPPCTFAEIARRPTWAVPFIALCVLSDYRLGAAGPENGLAQLF